MNEQTAIVGIDLGTTNSVLAAFVDGQVQAIEFEGSALLPSVVGMTLDNKVITGYSARNQLVAFPDRTVASIKRKMGGEVTVEMAGQKYSPQEISGMILRGLRDRAEQILNQPIRRAVITVPAFFDESQRLATRQAGELAGLTVERIINEPTAACLVYPNDDHDLRHVVVYDLGGGTFDVSVVRVEQGVIEVLTSKGNTQLGGDDFDCLLMDYVAKAFLSQTGIDLLANSRTRWRLLQACERAKCSLSTEASVRIFDEFIVEHDGVPHHLDIPIDRQEYERMIGGLVNQTIDCVDQALRDAGLTLDRIDDLILVGGSTRTPLVQRRLREEFRREPRWAVNPDLAVALGAATQGAMQDGSSPGPVLIDVATHSLGIQALEEFSRLVYVPLIHRNSPLPASFEDTFYKHDSQQAMAEINVFQGESENLDYNRFIGSFKLEGIAATQTQDTRVQVRLDLSLNGTLSVTARDVATGKVKSLQIDNALSQWAAQDKSAAKQRIDSFFGLSTFDDTQPVADRNCDNVSDQEPSVDSTLRHRTDSPDRAPSPRLVSILQRAEQARHTASSEDGEDLRRLTDAIQSAENTGDDELIESLCDELDELLFFVVG